MKKILTLLMIAVTVASCSKDDQPAAPTLELSSKNAIEFTAAAPANEAVEITVTTNQPSWDAVSDQTWCVVTKSGNKFTVTAVPNTLTTAPAPAMITVSAGGATPVKIAVTQKAVIAVIGVVIGDYYPDDVNPVGIIFRVKTATQKGLVVSLTEAPSDVVWSNGAFKTSAIDENDGTVNMTAIQTYLETSGKTWSELPPFNYIVTTMNGRTTYDAARDKWYLPSLNEWKEFAAVFSGKVYKDITGWGIVSPMLGYNDPSCAAARTAFNAKLSSKGGTPLDLSHDTGWYWSSTEHRTGDNVVYSFGFETGSASADTKNLTSRVRAVLAF